MKKMNLLKLTSLKLKEKEMDSLKGGGCTAKCGSDYRAGAQKVTEDIKNHAMSFVPEN